jgi:hypothetical protein
VVAIVVGAAAAVVRGASFDTARTIGIPRGAPAAVIGAGVVQVVIAVLPNGIRDDAARPLALLSAAVTSACLVVVGVVTPTLRRAALVIGVGWVLNALVIVPNGGMPVSRTAAASVGLRPALDDDDPLRRHVELDDDTRLAFLGDTVGVRVGPERAVMSPGDFVLLAGIALAAHDLLARREPAPEDLEREEVRP